MALKAGDKVRILRASTKYEDGYKWENCWVESMDKAIGKIATIKYIDNAGVEVEYKGEYWQYKRYPIFVLQLIGEQLLFSFMEE